MQKTTKTISLNGVVIAETVVVADPAVFVIRRKRFVLLTQGVCGLFQNFFLKFRYKTMQPVAIGVVDIIKLEIFKAF